MAIEMVEENNSCTRIVVVGVGGAGSNSINRMIDANVKGVEFIAVNTDKQALKSCKATRKIHIGEKITGGRGAGAIPDIGEKAANESKEEIKEVLRNANMVFIAAGMGGGTGTGASPIVAKIAKDLGALTIGVVTTPFNFEKKVKGRVAEEGISKLRSVVDTLIVISNQALLNNDENITLKETWMRADNVLMQGVSGISDLIINPGEINIDFADVQTVMKEKGQAIMGVGIGRGENAAIDAVTMAIQNPLMPNLLVDNAKAVLVNISGSSKMKTKQFHDVMKFIENSVTDDSLVIPGQSFDDSLNDAIKVTIIATGFESIDRTGNTDQFTEVQKVKTQSTIQVSENLFHYNDYLELISKSKDVKQTTNDLEEPAFMRKFKEAEKGGRAQEYDFLIKKN